MIEIPLLFRKMSNLITSDTYRAFTCIVNTNDGFYMRENIITFATRDDVTYPRFTRERNINQSRREQDSDGRFADATSARKKSRIFLGRSWSEPASVPRRSESMAKHIARFDAPLFLRMRC